MAENNDKNIHKDHRKRMKQRFKINLFENFAPHEVLEFALFFSIPQGNVNPLAHELIERFGSVSGVLNAEDDELMEVSGVGEHTILMLRMIPNLFKYASLEEYKPGVKFINLESVAEYFVNYFIGVNNEEVAVMLLDNRNSLITVETVSRGTTYSAEIAIGIINEKIVKYKAKSFILAHTHPNRDVAPSSDDIRTTEYILKSFERLNVLMHDHFIISGNKWYALRKGVSNDKKLLNLNCDIDTSLQLISTDEVK